MSEQIQANVGKHFVVTLQSMVSSSNYGWCLSSLPKGVVLADKYDIATKPGIAPIDQIFVFLAKEAGENLEIIFELLNLSNPLNCANTVKVLVTVTPAEAVNNSLEEAKEFVQYSDNSASYNMNANCEYVYQGTMDTCNLKYGYPVCDNKDSNTILAYGYPAPIVKYGYPVLKYGYPTEQ
ncbi:hypothetical protein [Anaeromicropila populeti]|uniref:Uncharacterized protein n=1 Tax=Anaeromicropila populeti TaxID=37658 RepID=A0A1I6KYN1_9FIRM|nr:hypothetical protein [Anaeromicropila populeti]SFR96332.1 hypothetical protein SAMN05661086_02920 [Anaeromicropila populeti]